MRSLRWDLVGIEANFGLMACWLSGGHVLSREARHGSDSAFFPPRGALSVCPSGLAASNGTGSQHTSSSAIDVSSQ